jgi:hypothetical protein
MLLGNQGSFLGRGTKRSLLRSSKTKFGVCPTNLVGKRTDRKAKNSPPSFAQLKNAESYTTTPLYLILMDVTLCIPLYLFFCKQNKSSFQNSMFCPKHVPANGRGPEVSTLWRSNFHPNYKNSLSAPKSMHTMPITKTNQLWCILQLFVYNYTKCTDMCGQSADLFNITLGGWYTQPVAMVKEGNKKGADKAWNYLKAQPSQMSVSTKFMNFWCRAEYNLYLYCPFRCVFKIT